MTPVRPPVKVTYFEYSTLPETGPRYQLVEGELIMTPAPSYRHQTVQVRLTVALYNFAEPRGLGIVRGSPLDVILSQDSSPQPDVVYVSAARRSIIAPEGLRGAPDLCIEVLSERTKSLDRVAKRALYARHGVTEYWIVDPDANTVDLYRLQEDPNEPAIKLTASDTLTTALLAGFTLDLRAIFAP